ncbi:hypothetical protein TH8_10145 [Thalassospira profundimaris]|nr:hypothetical protein TH8_10145 [Thalassospira profundimaris]
MRIQGINFQNTLYDTDDLSTNRGASLAYLTAPDAIIAKLAAEQPDLKVETVFTGASGGVYSVEGMDAETLDQKVVGLLDQLGKGEGDGVLAICRHLTFAGAAVEITGKYTEAENLAEALIRKRQLQSPTIDIANSERDNLGRCRIDGFRPADGGMITTGAGKRAVSQSVYDRRTFGREMRQAFYKAELSQAENSADIAIPDQFANSFQDIVADPPAGLAESLQSKMAVLYMDGNAFGKIRTAYLSGEKIDIDQQIKRARTFSDHVVGRRRALLAAILSRLEEIAKRDSDGFKAVYLTDEDGGPKCRFETLLWGGDEMTFVFPAWLLEPVLDCVAENLCDPAWGLSQTGEMLTHGGGVVVCNAKTPIREAMAKVGDIADHGKDFAKKAAKPFSGFEYLILESEAPPPDVNAWRETFYGTADASAFTINFDRDYAALRNLVHKVKGKAVLSRGQVYDLLRGARAAGLDGADKVADAKAFVENWIDTTPVLTADAKAVITEMQSSNAFGGAVHPLLPFKRLAELWDYFDIAASRVSVPTRAQEVENV